MSDTTPSAGAMPAAAGATPAQTPAQPAAATAPAAGQPATGDPDADGMTTDAGRRAIRAEREAKAALQRELDELKSASQSDHDKAIAAAKKEGAAEVLGKYEAAVRRSEVRAALSAAGISPSLLDLAVKADEFSGLKVTDGGDVEGLASAVDAFKKAKPDLFKPAAGNGAAPDFGGGPRGTPAGAGADMNSIIRRAAGRTA